MKQQSVFEKYPWYGRHQRAVDTLARFLALDREQVINGLDAKIRPVQWEPAVSHKPLAA